MAVINPTLLQQMTVCMRLLVWRVQSSLIYIVPEDAPPVLGEMSHFKGPGYGKRYVRALFSFLYGDLISCGDSAKQGLSTFNLCIQWVCHMAVDPFVVCSYLVVMQDP